MLIVCDSGRHALRSGLFELGYELDGKDLDDVFWRFKAVAEKEKVTCGTLGLSTATVKLIGIDGVEHIACSVGTGLVDSAYKAIDQIVKRGRGKYAAHGDLHFGRGFPRGARGSWVRPAPHNFPSRGLRGVGGRHLITSLVKLYLGLNFVRLILGLESNTQKFLEVETRAKVRIQGTKVGSTELAEMVWPRQSHLFDWCTHDAKVNSTKEKLQQHFNQHVERRFSYAPSKEDIENAILGDHKYSHKS
ncbi:hypothetical protein IFM89_025144 [Coptis chinensis]|uniref:Uncharacterized protein n=1 Tax=Coptis chinensis TaxID=261450 RepID=A0A835HUU1_9MAGN|nr:hypothetical protein IFM89_025144 [Coptis chinensis]